MPVFRTVVTCPASVAVSAPAVADRSVPAAFTQPMSTETAPRAAGVYTSAAVLTVSPGRTGCPDVPVRLCAIHCPARPAAVSSSECAPSAGQTGVMSGRFPGTGRLTTWVTVSVASIRVFAMGSTGTPVNPNPVGQGPGWTVNLTPGLRALTCRSPGVMLGAHDAGTRKYDPSFGAPEGVKDYGAVNAAP